MDIKKQTKTKKEGHNNDNFTVKGIKKVQAGKINMDRPWPAAVEQSVGSESESPLDAYIVPRCILNWFFGLVLLPVEGERGVYERIGCISMGVYGDDISDDLESSRCDPLAEECVSIDVVEKGSKRFIIELV
jgi:hypothetical protein